MMDIGAAMYADTASHTKSSPLVGEDLGGGFLSVAPSTNTVCSESAPSLALPHKGGGNAIANLTQSTNRHG